MKNVVVVSWLMFFNSFAFADEFFGPFPNPENSTWERDELPLFYSDKEPEFVREKQKEDKVRHTPQMAVIGDSISVGSFTSPRLVWDLLELEKLLKLKNLDPDPKDRGFDKFLKTIGQKEGTPIVPPKRLWETIAEHPKLSAAEKFTKGLEFSLRATYAGGYIDVEEYAWPYLVGRQAGIDPKEILIPAEAGNRSGDALRQAKRLLLDTKGLLPKHIFILFTGNDLCSQDLKENKDDVRQHYSKHILSAAKELLEKGRVSEGSKTTVHMMSHFQIAQLVETKSVLEKEIFAYGKARSCRDFRLHEPQEDVASKLTDPTLKLVLKGLGNRTNLPPSWEMCRSILKTDPQAKGYKERLGSIKEYIKTYQSAAADVVKQANDLRDKDFPKQEVRFNLLQAPESFLIEGEDIANDCFHMSLEGQIRFSSDLIAELRRQNYFPKARD